MLSPLCALCHITWSKRGRADWIIYHIHLVHQSIESQCQRDLNGAQRAPRKGCNNNDGKNQRKPEYMIGVFMVTEWK